MNWVFWDWNLRNLRLDSHYVVSRHKQAIEYNGFSSLAVGCKHVREKCCYSKGSASFTDMLFRPSFSFPVVLNLNCRWPRDKKERRLWRREWALSCSSLFAESPRDWKFNWEKQTKPTRPAIFAIFQPATSRRRAYARNTGFRNSLRRLPDYPLSARLECVTL